MKCKYKAVPRINQGKGRASCEGCVGNVSDEKCLEITELIAERKIKSCVGSRGVIYKEIK